MHSGRKTHIDIYDFVPEKMNDGMIEFRYCPLSQMLATGYILGQLREMSRIPNSCKFVCKSEECW